jgi:arsenite-transporting ATPase
LEIRDRYGRAIDALFDRLSRGSAFDASHDRHVMRDLIDLAPPGIDELIAITEVTDAIAIEARYDLMIMDTAPSGHALRLLAMPEIVRDWVKALMSILLKYGLVGGLEDVGRLLVNLSQGLGRLREALQDPDRARFVAVTRPEILPVLETARMLDRLTALGIRVPTVIVNAIGVGTCRNCERVRAAQAEALGVLERKLRSRSRSFVLARAEMPPPRGPRSLLQWRAGWQIRKA